MSIMPKKDNPNDFTEDEIAFARGSSVPNEIKAHLARRHEDNGVGTSFYRKVAANASAKAAALLSVRELEGLLDEYATAEAARKQAKVLEQQNAALTATVSRKDAEILRLRATPALAVHSS